MNKEEFQMNRVQIKSLFTAMFNQMNNMYDQLAQQDQKIEKARKEGYEEGFRDAKHLYEILCCESQGNEELKLVPCKECKCFSELQHKVTGDIGYFCFKGHNGHPNMGCSEGEPKE